MHVRAGREEAGDGALVPSKVPRQQIVSRGGKRHGPQLQMREGHWHRAALRQYEESESLTLCSTLRLRETEASLCSHSVEPSM